MTESTSIRGTRPIGSTGRTGLTGLRILHVHTLPIVSGSGINTLLTLQGNAAAGAEVALACAPGGRLQDLVGQSGLRFHPIPSFVAEVSPRKDLQTLIELVRIMRRGRYHVVHTHNSKGGFLGRLAARIAGVPHIVHTVHGFAFHDQESRWRRKLFVLLERLAATWCHQFISISQPMIDWAAREGIAPPDRFLKIPSGIEVSRFRDAEPDPALRRMWGLEADVPVIGMVAKLWEGKGHRVLLCALQRLVRLGCRFKVLIVGEGDLEFELRRMSRNLAIEDRVVFTGFRSDVPEVTALFDIAVLPSFFEGMGRVALEAMAARKPIVASAVGGLVELIEDGVNGYLVPAGDAAQLGDRLRRLLEDGQLRCEMGRQAARRVDEQYSVREMVESIHRVYLSLSGRVRDDATLQEKELGRVTAAATTQENQPMRQADPAQETREDAA